MNTRLVVASLLVAGLWLGLMATPAPRAEAQARRHAQWEYRVFKLTPADYIDKADYKAILREKGIANVEPAFYEHVLNELGKQGWQLVGHERRSRNLLYFHLKRPR